MDSAKNRIIKDVTNEDDRIQITGHVDDLDEEILRLSDNSGNIQVDTSEVGEEISLKKGDLINVIGNLVITTKGEKILKADIIQDMNKLNFKYYLKLYELKKELEEQ